MCRNGDFILWYLSGINFLFGAEQQAATTINVYTHTGKSIDMHNVISSLLNHV